MSSLPAVDNAPQRGWGVLATVLAIETFGGLALLIPIVTAMLESSDEPLGQRLSIFLAALIALIWICVTLFAALRVRASWVRASAITIHVLMFAAGTGILQLQLASQILGWGLVALALVGFFAALRARPVVREDDLEV